MNVFLNDNLCSSGIIENEFLRSDFTHKSVDSRLDRHNGKNTMTYL